MSTTSSKHPVNLFYRFSESERLVPLLLGDMSWIREEKKGELDIILLGVFEQW